MNFQRRPPRKPLQVAPPAKYEGSLINMGPLGLENQRMCLGRSAELGHREKEGLSQTLVYASAVGKGERRAPGDSLASAMAVTCSYRASNDEARARPPRVLGKIKWGTDGHQCTAYFDWMNGTVLQVTSSSIEVSCEIITSPTPDDLVGAIDPEAKINVGAFLGYWPSSRKAPTLTDLVPMPAPTDDAPGFVYLLIPEFARAVTIYGVPPEQAQWASGPNASAFQFAPVDTTVIKSSVQYQRPGNATHLYLQSETQAFYTVVWELAL